MVRIQQVEKCETMCAAVIVLGHRKSMSAFRIGVGQVRQPGASSNAPGGSNQLGQGSSRAP